MHVIQCFNISNFIMGTPTANLINMIWFYVSHDLFGMVTVLITFTSKLVLLFQGGDSLKPAIPKISTAQNQDE